MSKDRIRALRGYVIDASRERYVEGEQDEQRAG
jgi:hypothetical protein